MGHKIPRAMRASDGSIVDPFIKVHLSSTGLKGSQGSQTFQTAVVTDNGFNPTYVRSYRPRVALAPAVSAPT
jgi:hypothetical protein